MVPRKPVNYEAMTEPPTLPRSDENLNNISTSSLNSSPTSSHSTPIANHSTVPSTIQQPPLPRRTNLAKHTKQFTNSSSNSDLINTLSRSIIQSQSSASLDTAAILPPANSGLNRPTVSFLYTQKKLFSGDNLRSTLSHLDTSHMDDMASNIGLSRSGNSTIKKHIRGSTRNTNLDDASSFDSGKSNRDEIANRFKQTYAELEALRKRNEELERMAASSDKTKENAAKVSDTSTAADSVAALKMWSEIEECTLEILNALGIPQTPAQLLETPPKAIPVALDDSNLSVLKETMPKVSETTKVMAGKDKGNSKDSLLDEPVFETSERREFIASLESQSLDSVTDGKIPTFTSEELGEINNKADSIFAAISTIKSNQTPSSVNNVKSMLASFSSVGFSEDDWGLGL